MNWLLPLSLGLGTGLAAYGGNALLLPWLQRRGILDHPNERSSHRVPTPRGGGLAVTAAALAGWLAVALVPQGGGEALAGPLAGALILAFACAYEDFRGLGVGTRLMMQAGAIALGLASLGGDAMIFQGSLPLWLDRLAAGVIWLWFVNLYNFMDGIDGITAIESASLALGLGLTALLMALPVDLGLAALALGAAALGFLPWNWHPAKLFLGDVGSVPMGYLAGFLLLWLAAHGSWAAALILPAYYLADATSTLMLRLARGQAVWRAHREHAYQRAVAYGASHAAVSLRVAAANGVLVGLALLSLAGGGFAPAALAGAAVWAALTVWYLRRSGTRPLDAH